MAVAGRPVAGAGMLQGLIETAPIGEDLTVTIERGGQRQDVIVRPQAQPVAAVMGRVSPGRASSRKPGPMAFAAEFAAANRAVPRRHAAAPRPFGGRGNAVDARSDPADRAAARRSLARSPQEPTRGEPSMNPGH